MRILLLFLIALGFGFGISSSAIAVCQQTGNTPSGGNAIDCPAPIQNGQLDLASTPNTTIFGDEINIPAGGGINEDTGGLSAIVSDDGNDVITTSGNVTGNQQAIFSGDGDDTITVNGGVLRGLTSQAIFSSAGADKITINGGLLVGEGAQAIFSGNEPDMITINSGTLISEASQVIFSGGGEDMIVVNGGTLDNSLTVREIFFTGGEDDTVILNGGTYIGGEDEVIFLGGDNDTLTFGADIDLGGFVNCGSGTDTIIFAMGVPLNRIPLVTEQINNLPTPDGSIIINGITYEYIDCEELVADLRVPEGLPIPTLSQWGLIAMAGLIGLAGLVVMRRRVSMNI